VVAEYTANELRVELAPAPFSDKSAESRA